MSCLLAGFTANGIGGSAAYAALQLHAALLPAALLSCLLAGFIAESDLDSTIGSIISGLCRHGSPLRHYNNQDWDEHSVHRQKSALVSYLLAGTIAGGIYSSAASPPCSDDTARHRL